MGEAEWEGLEVGGERLTGWQRGQKAGEGVERSHRVSVYCLSVCLSVSDLPVHLSVCLSLSVCPSLCLCSKSNTQSLPPTGLLLPSLLNPLSPFTPLLENVGLLLAACPRTQIINFVYFSGENPQ